jgi:hypothetical protein
VAVSARGSRAFEGEFRAADAGAPIAQPHALSQDADPGTLTRDPDKVELEESGELKALLPDADDRRAFMFSLRVNHGDDTRRKRPRDSNRDKARPGAGRRKATVARANIHPGNATQLQPKVQQWKE